MNKPATAQTPEDLVRLFAQFANAGDVDGLVSLYEADAVVAVGQPVARGHDEIRGFYRDLLSRKSDFAALEPLPALHNEELALTVTITGEGRCSLEVARRQPDGTWRWVIDQLKVKTIAE